MSQDQQTEVEAAFPKQVLGTFELASSLIHGGDETLGTTRLFRTKGWVWDDRVIQIPVVSGNALRGIWRRASARAFLDAYLDAGGEKLSLAAFHFLTSGGALSKGGGSSMDLKAERGLRELVPYVSLFGGAALGKIQEGKLWVDEAVPICEETVPRLRELWPGVEEAVTAEMSVRELIEVHGYSRQDDSKNDHWHRYLNDGAKSEASYLIEKTQKTETAPKAGTSQQMRYENVELVAGAVLFHRWGFRWEPTRDELAGLASGLLRWAERPHVGGRNAVGHGNLLVDYQGVSPETKLLTDGESTMARWEDETPEDRLREHVAEHVDEIAEVLGAI